VLSRNCNNDNNKRRRLRGGVLRMEMSKGWWVKGGRGDQGCAASFERRVGHRREGEVDVCCVGRLFLNYDSGNDIGNRG
jgi:hypothetical protein